MDLTQVETRLKIRCLRCSNYGEAVCLTRIDETTVCQRVRLIYPFSRTLWERRVSKLVRSRESWNTIVFVTQYSPIESSPIVSAWLLISETCVSFTTEDGITFHVTYRNTLATVSFQIHDRTNVRDKLCSCYVSNKTAAEVCHTESCTTFNDKFNESNTAGYIDDGIAELKTTFIPNTVCQSIRI